MRAYRITRAAGLLSALAALLPASAAVLMLQPDPPAAATSLYPGIPAPTSPVPSAIMPTLPTGADFDDHEWIDTYDPINVANPTNTVECPNWPNAEQANCYYVDSFDGSATDTSNPYGYPDLPRATIPAAAWLSGATYVEIHGNNTAYAANSPDYDLGAGTISCTLSGTSSDPVFFVGVDAPRIGVGGGGSDPIACSGIRHVIFDGITLQDRNNGNRDWPQFSIEGGSEYVTFRNGVIRGDNTETSGGQMIPITGDRTNGATRFIVFYNNVISDGGDHITNNIERDVHGWRPLWLVRYAWLIDNELMRMQADGVQVGNSLAGSGAYTPGGENENPDFPSHYIYIGGNTFYSMFENAVDFKNSFHGVVSKNTMYDFHATGTGGGANSTAFILSQDGEGSNSAFHWALYNEIYDVGVGIRASGNNDDDDPLTDRSPSTPDRDYAIGNIIYDATTGLAASHGAAGGESGNQEHHFINNTVFDVTTGIDINLFQNGGGSTLADIYIDGNIILEASGDDIDISGNNGLDHLEVTDNVAYKTTGTYQLGSADADTITGNSTGSDPLLRDTTAPGLDFTISSDASPAHEATTENAAYQLFEDMYGLSIREDQAGNARPASGAWDAGALQRQ